jgi:radical SAM/Cys-rich protein
MSAETARQVIDYLEATGATTLDITGGAPELSPHFRFLVREARARGATVTDRCNLTVLFEPGQEDTAQFLAANQVAVVASLPCYTEELVDRQRGAGVYDKSIEALRTLNALGYGREGSGLTIDLVYNPQGPSLPPSQATLEADYKRILGEKFGIAFNRLFTLANMPIQRFGSTLVTKGTFQDYMKLLRGAHRDENLESVMCRTLVSIDWRGYLYDCDFNQMLGIPIAVAGKRPTHVADAIARGLDGRPIAIADHCYGCTAGQGSSCGGALA